MRKDIKRAGRLPQKAGMLIPETIQITGNNRNELTETIRIRLRTQQQRIRVQPSVDGHRANFEALTADCIFDRTNPICFVATRIAARRRRRGGPAVTRFAENPLTAHAAAVVGAARKRQRPHFCVLDRISERFCINRFEGVLGTLCKFSALPN
jgi:hypothetical protein